jgi:hypothetical protein
MRTFEQKIAEVIKHLPGTTQQITDRCPFSIGMTQDTLRRMLGLGIAVANEAYHGAEKTWHLTREGEYLRDKAQNKVS